MNQNVYLSKYRKNTLETATPEEIFLTLFNGLVNFVTLAKEALTEKNIQKTHNNVVKAQNILVEFVDTLDHSVNPDLAKNLERLYTYIIRLLSNANIKKDMKAMEEALKLLTELRDTWRQAAEINKKEKSSSFQSTKNSSDEDVESDADDEDEPNEEIYERYDFAG